MAQQRKYATAKDPRKRYPKLRNDLRKRVLATQDVCGICGREVDKTLPPGTPLSPEIDEIIPVARGGSPYDIDNLQLTHKICNQRKGTKMVGDSLEQVDNPLPVSRNWQESNFRGQIEYRAIFDYSPLYSHQYQSSC